MKHSMQFFFGTFALSALIALSGCTKEEKTVAGVLIGAGTGAAIGGAAGGGGAAAIGAVLGGTAGGIIGYESGDDRECQCHHHNHHHHEYNDK